MVQWTLCINICINDLLIRLLGPYWEIQSRSSLYGPSLQAYIFFTSLYILAQCVQITCPVLKCPKIRQNKNLWNFENFPWQNSGNLKNGQFSPKVEKGSPYHVTRTGC